MQSVGARIIFSTLSDMKLHLSANQCSPSVIDTTTLINQTRWMSATSSRPADTKVAKDNTTSNSTSDTTVNDTRRSDLSTSSSTSSLSSSSSETSTQSLVFGSVEEIRATSARIFNNYNNVDADGKLTNKRTGRKIMNKPLIGAKVASYYPEDPFKMDPFFEDPDEERCGRHLILDVQLCSPSLLVVHGSINLCKSRLHF